MDSLDNDYGLFGPDSVTWIVHSHQSGWVGGVRALLLQALEPRAMAGVTQFTQFSSDTWSRFNSTTEFVMQITYRPKSDALAAIQKVRNIHESIVGIDPYSGLPYSANDPYLLAYVHNCLVDSLLNAYISIAKDLSLHDRDRYVKEMSVVAKLIGADMSEIPIDATSLEYWLSSQRSLMVTDDVRSAAGALENLNIPVQLSRIWRIAWNCAVSLLPKFALEMYGYEINENKKNINLVFASIMAKTMKLMLPSHQYYREAKFEYYKGYQAIRRDKDLEFMASLFS